MLAVLEQQACKRASLRCGSGSSAQLSMTPVQTTLADVKEKACQEHSQFAALVILTIDGESCEDRLDQTLSDIVPTGKRVSLVLQQVHWFLPA